MNFSLFQNSHVINTAGYEERLPENTYYSKVSFNTYGPRQSARAVIPTIITQLLAGSTEIKLGSIHPTRDFNFVRDTVDGFIEIAETQATIGEEINIASQQEISIGQLAHEIIDQINPTARVISDDMRIRPEKSEVERLLGSNEKIRRLTGWQPEYTLKEGIRETIEWFKNAENLRYYKWNVFNI